MSKNLFNIQSVYVTDSIGRGVENQPDISGGKFVEGIQYPEGFKQRVSTETPEYMLKEMGTYPVYQTIVRDILYGAIPQQNDTIYWGISTSPDPYDDHNNGKFGGSELKLSFRSLQTNISIKKSRSISRRSTKHRQYLKLLIMGSTLLCLNYNTN